MRSLEKLAPKTKLELLSCKIQSRKKTYLLPFKASKVWFSEPTLEKSINANKGFIRHLTLFFEFTSIIHYLFLYICCLRLLFKLMWCIFKKHDSEQSLVEKAKQNIFSQSWTSTDLPQLSSNIQRGSKANIALTKPNLHFHYDQLNITLMEKLNQCIMQGQVNMGLIDDVWLQKQTSNHLVNRPRPPVYK